MKTELAPTMSTLDDDACRVLIVEDNSDAAAFLTLALERQGHVVQATRNGTEALTVAAYFQPHIALIDIGLPGLDGIYVTTMLRRTNRRMLIVAVTGHSTPDDVNRTRQAGCDHHLPKPVDLPSVIQLMAAWKAEGGCRDECDAAR